MLRRTRSSLIDYSSWSPSGGRVKLTQTLSRDNPRVVCSLPHRPTSPTANQCSSHQRQDSFSWTKFPQPASSTATGKTSPGYSGDPICTHSLPFPNLGWLHQHASAQSLKFWGLVQIPVTPFVSPKVSRKQCRFLNLGFFVKRELS